MIEAVDRKLADYIADAATRRDSCLTVGLCGTQGSGKSTLAAAVQALLQARNLSVAVLSIDDLYLTRKQRLELAEKVHSLLRTRGVPGTHDVALGMDTLRALATRGIAAIPSFDKSRDDRRPWDQWPTVTAPMQVVIFEGWCVGAVPQATALLAEPVNALEREHDADGSWRRYVNDALAGAYRPLFGRLDQLILLQAPSFDVVYRWRLEQEHKLRQQVAAQGGDPSRVMSDAQVRTFISHYERLTRHILSEMPSRADVVVSLDESRRAKALTFAPNVCR